MSSSVTLSRRRLFKRDSQPLISLPWVNPEVDFIATCTRCEACVSACETNIIRHGDGGFPTIDFSQGECTFCQQCADACPEPIFDTNQSAPWPEQKVAVTQSCLAHQGVYCRSCGELCEQEAISFKPGISSVPEIDVADCTGCGACIAPCPTQAIAVIQLPEEDHV